MSVYPLPLQVGPAAWQDNGSVLSPMASRDVAIGNGKKFYLDGPIGNDYLISPSDGVLDYYAAGTRRFGMSASSGFYNSPGLFESGVGDGAAAVGFSFSTPSYTTAGARLFVLRNGTTEKLTVDKDGFVTFGTFSSRLQLGSGNYGATLFGNYLPGASSTVGHYVNLYCSTGSGSGVIYGNQAALFLHNGTNISSYRNIYSTITANAGSTVTGASYAIAGVLAQYAGSTLSHAYLGHYSAEISGTITGSLRVANSAVTVNSGATLASYLGDERNASFASGATITGEIIADESRLLVATSPSLIRSRNHGLYLLSGGSTGSIIGSYDVTSVESGALVTGSLRGSQVDVIANGSIGGWIYGHVDRVYSTASASQSHFGTDAWISFTGSASPGWSVGINGWISFAGTSAATDEVDGSVGRVSLGDSTSAPIAIGAVGGIMMNSSGTASSRAEGACGWIWIDKSTDPSSPLMAGGVTSFYGTPGISLSSAFSLGGSSARASVIAKVYDSANTIPHAAVLAFITDGNGDGVPVPAAFKAVDCRTVAGNGYNYGLDLKKEAGLNNGIKLADIRGHGGDTIKNTTAGEWEFSAGIKPPSLADSSANNGTIYYSTDQAKLVYKDSGGTVHDLY